MGSFLLSAAWLVLLQFAAIHAMLREGARAPRLRLGHLDACGLRISRGGSSFFATNEAVLRELEHACLLGEPDDVRPLLARGDTADAIAALPRRADGSSSGNGNSNGNGNGNDAKAE